MEKPKAIITSKARIFLLEIFRIARLIIPIGYHHQVNLGATKKRVKGFNLGSYWAYGLFQIFLFLVALAIR